MKRTRCAAIDVGTTKVCTIMADGSGLKGFRILGVGIASSRGLHKGIVVNVNEAKEAIRESVWKAERVAGYRLGSAYVGVTGQHISSQNAQGAIAVTRNDQLVRSDDLKRLLQVAHSTTVPNERQLLHVIPRTYKVDGQEGIKNPLGMHGFRLDIETHVISAGIASIQNLTKCIRSIGVEIEDMVLEPLASAEAVLTDQEKQDGVMLADIGSGTTDIAVFKDGNIYHTSVLPVAGYQITRDIAIGLGLSFDLAEEMKKKYANVSITTDSISQSGNTLTSDGHIISYSELLGIVRVRVEELLRLVVLELPRADYHKLVPSGLVLTGGGANLPGIAEFAETVTRLPVRIGVPVKLDGVSDALQDPAYATSVGLILWQASNENRQDCRTKESIPQRFVTEVLRLFH